MVGNGCWKFMISAGNSSGLDLVTLFVVLDEGRRLQVADRGGTFLIPKNRDSGSLTHFGGIGVKGIEKDSFSRFPIPHFTNRE